ncbi:MAG: SAM-dependent methyltransferase [Myxococcota bacterium]|jgi:SAM-dependent methyltransferase
MDRTRYTRIGHGDRRFWNPIPDAALTQLLRGLPLQPAPVAVDIGCGRGEALAVLAGAHGATGLGIDPDTAALASADVPGIRWIGERFSPSMLPDGGVDVLLALGSVPWEVVANLGPALRPGGRLVVGDGVLRRPAHADYAAFFGDLPPALPDWRARAEAAGWHLRQERHTTLAEWDAYEELHAARIRAWCHANPDDLDTPAYRARVAMWHGMYRRLGRGVLGFGVFVLEAA